MCVVIPFGRAVPCKFVCWRVSSQFANWLPKLCAYSLLLLFPKSFQLVSLTFYAAVFMFFFISDLVRCMNTFLELVYHCSDIFCGFLSRCDFVFICWYDDIWLFPLWRYSYFFNWNLPVVIIVLVKNNHLFHLLIEFSTMRGTYSLFGMDLLKLKTFKILKAI